MASARHKHLSTHCHTYHEPRDDEASKVGLSAQSHLGCGMGLADPQMQACIVPCAEHTQRVLHATNEPGRVGPSHGAAPTGGTPSGPGVSLRS
jgi:hypothetical protein